MRLSFLLALWFAIGFQWGFLAHVPIHHPKAFPSITALYKKVGLINERELYGNSLQGDTGIREKFSGRSNP
jgi:hypothetical protein